MNKQNPKVVVVGSFNTDLVVKAERRPQTGETLMGEEFGIVYRRKREQSGDRCRALGGKRDNDRQARKWIFLETR